jgi:hypothetical protein
MMPLRPVAPIRHFFRDGPRSLLRRQVPVEPVDADKVVVTIGVAFAIAMIGLVIYSATPNHWIAGIEIVVVAGVLWMATQRLIARWPRDERDHLPDAEIFIPLPLALSSIVFPIAWVTALSVGGHGLLGNGFGLGLVASWGLVSRRYHGRVRADKERARATARRLRLDASAPSSDGP